MHNLHEFWIDCKRNSIILQKEHELPAHFSSMCSLSNNTNHFLLALRNQVLYRAKIENNELLLLEQMQIDSGRLKLLYLPCSSQVLICDWKEGPTKAVDIKMNEKLCFGRIREIAVNPESRNHITSCLVWPPVSNTNFQEEIRVIFFENDTNSLHVYKMKRIEGEQ